MWRSGSRRHLATAGFCLLTTLSVVSASAAQPETVYFPSADGHTELTGYLFKPQGAGPFPAIIMLHGRGGPYSSNVNADCTLVSRAVPASPCNAGTLSKRHIMWGDYWAERGYLALLPDSFGPRGKAHGFGRFTHDDPDRADVNERTVRPLDAEGALTYLRQRRDAAVERIVLQGWSNGGSTVLNVLLREGLQSSLRGALIFYPGCGESSLLGPTLRSRVPIQLFLAADDEEVSPTLCNAMAERSRQAGTAIDTTIYPGATHGFDEPSASRQATPGNGPAMDDTLRRAAPLVFDWLKQ
ncbi:putative Dienelactone hydrolase family protein, putative signal peptide [Bradyrhizobium sp. ORS 278]|uniref:dienelactone hydrolase family protein n=1 Tax=Bradyrhizobium sp. (strain ORS 278) TaxID=114615 RepID=UPI0001508439|nr:dienelactone hydrolase family protein [Bradyrhizobium sp. ORS 278]CAL77188.1 putative Dienelactone hydrolase family protein, putative signal peptide [Bradyrhizobium sp. ORS 278]